MYSTSPFISFNSHPYPIYPAKKNTWHIIPSLIIAEFVEYPHLPIKRCCVFQFILSVIYLLIKSKRKCLLHELIPPWPDVILIHVAKIYVLLYLPDIPRQSVELYRPLSELVYFNDFYGLALIPMCLAFVSRHLSKTCSIQKRFLWYNYDEWREHLHLENYLKVFFILHYLNHSPPIAFRHLYQ